MTNELPIRLLQPVGGARVAVRPLADGGGQDILVEATPLGERLAWFLAALDGDQAPAEETIRDRRFYVIRHSVDLDDGVIELVDTLIGLRLAHPRLVQLELNMEVRP